MVALAFAKLDEVHALLVRIADERGLLAPVPRDMEADLARRVRDAKARKEIAA